MKSNNTPPPGGARDEIQEVFPHSPPPPIMRIPRHYYEGYFSEFEDYLLQQKHTVQRYNKGETLFKKMPVANVYFYILEGQSMVYGITMQGEKKVQCYYGAGCFSSLAISEELDSIYYNQNNEALSDMTVLLFERETILKILQERFDFVLAMLEFTNELAALLSYHNLTLAYLPSLTKLCDFLYMSYVHCPSQQKDTPHLVYYSQEQIANYIGVTRTQVSRLLKTLKEQNLIETRRGCIEIIDPQQLLARCSRVVNLQP